MMKRSGGLTLRIIVGCYALALLAALGGCAGYTKKADSMLATYRGGDCATALAEAQGMVNEADKRDKLIWLLEAGTVARTAGHYEQSNALFDQADEILTEYEQKPEVSITAETGATVTTQALLPYRGRTYDAIMLNTYKALNYMQLGNLDAARVELNRAYERQRLAVEANAKRIEKAKDEAEKEKGSYDVERARQDEKFQGQFDAAYGDLSDPAEQAEYEPYANYVNPLSEFVQGLFFMTAAADASDLERGAKSMQRVAGMAQHNPFVAEDLALSDKAANGEKMPPLTYVIYETGLAPYRKTIRIDIPVFVAGQYSGGVDYVGAAFPDLEDNDDYLPAIQVATAEGRVQPRLLCSMDRVIKQDFKNELPIVITQTLISTGVKAGTAYGANEATKGDALANAFTRIGTSLYQVGMNQADERTWTTLPKQFQYCRFYTPQDGQAVIQSGSLPQTLSLDPSKVNVVWARSVAAGSPLQICQFSLP
ncbi:MAG: hypothetical protein IT445_21035 [Phycisphaeraceae bacterium]|nr:hypothetical protein [Phycisphaeraceae bacterium]